MTKADRLIILKFIHQHKQMVKEAKALKIKQDSLIEFFKNHPDFESWNKLRIGVKRIDPKWLDSYILGEG